MTKLRVIAKFGGWEVVQDANGVVSICFQNGQWVCNHGSAFEAIRSIQDPPARTELLKQWAAYMSGGSHV